MSPDADFSRRRCWRSAMVLTARWPANRLPKTVLHDVSQPEEVAQRTHTANFRFAWRTVDSLPRRNLRFGRIAALRGVASESPVSAVFETIAIRSTTQQRITRAALIPPASLLCAGRRT